MSSQGAAHIKAICKAAGNDPARLMDIAIAVQKQLGAVSDTAIDLIATHLKIPRVDVDSLVTFYAFFSKTPKGRVIIRLCNDVVDQMNGAAEVAAALETELGIRFGETSPDGAISLEYAPCIGLSDQAPAALINDVPVTHLDSGKARHLAQLLKREGTQARLVKTFGDGHNAHDLIRSMVVNNIREIGPVILAPYTSGSGLKKALALSPAEVIRDIKTSRLRGRGGAGFPTGMKWDFTRQAGGDQRFIICNADEGEPGTFKDRVLMTECPDLIFEGMTIAGYAVGAAEGIFYLRAEYAYLEKFITAILAQRRKAGQLGQTICGKAGFHFDIRLQMGAGAYVCGEETALISSCEGRRGDPKNRPPFPAQKGYKGCPTSVNNAETLCCVARILECGPGWFAAMGTKGSAGTKLLSISGDCARPGVYEVPFGVKVSDLLKKVGADHTAAIQVGGPSGRMIGPKEFNRIICYDDLSTGGSFILFNKGRNVVDIARQFMDFFVEESCGYCTPCRVGNVLLRNKLVEILAGHGAPEDLAYLEELGRTTKLASRCGLGQTSPNPVLSTLENFRPAYEALFKKGRGHEPVLANFDLQAALSQGSTLAGRASSIFTPVTGSQP
jgi:[NiFe] hydrogenase diaphorase moiety large subunit